MINFLDLTKKERASFFFVIILMVLGGIFSILPIQYMEKMANLAVAGSKDKIAEIVFLGALYILFEIAANLFTYSGKYIADILQYRIAGNLQVRLYEKLTRIGLQELKEHGSNELANVIIEDTAFLSNYLLKPVTDLVFMTVTFLCGLYYMIHVSWILAVIIIPLGMLTSFSAKALGEKTNRNIEAERRASASLWKTFHEGIRGIIALRISQAEKRYGDQVKKDSENLKNINIIQSKLEKSNIAVVSVLFMGTIDCILLVSCLFVIHGKISVGSMTAVLMYNHMLVDPLVNLIDVRQTVIKLRVSLKRIYGVLEIKEELKKPRVRVDGMEADHLLYNIGSAPILKDVHFTISKGGKIAILGETGCGKTTLANIIAGLIDPTGGTVKYTYKGKEAQGIPRVSYLYQDGYLFDMDIKSNIKLSNPLISNEELKALIKICCLEKLVSQNSGPIGENGQKLSGGEQKRICIARALANNNADIYIFDELSTSLDGETAQIITRNILEALKDPICIFIEHNLEIAGLMDEVIYLEDTLCRL